MSAPQVSPRETPRFRKQCLRIMAFFTQHPRGWFSLPEIARAIGATSEAGVSARLRQLTGKPYCWMKEKRIRKGALREYKLVPPGAPTQLDLLP